MKSVEVAERALADLCTRDVIQLLDSGEEKQARAVMKMTGMSKTDVNKTVKEHDDMKKQTDVEAIEQVHRLCIEVIKLLDAGKDVREIMKVVMVMVAQSKTDMEEAVDLVEELLDWTHLDDMIKDFKKKSDKKDDDFLGCCISLRGQAKDFLKKHGREEK